MNSQLYAALRHTGLVRPLATPDEPEGGINVMALNKGEEKYIFLYSDSHKADVLLTIGRFAGNPELSFSWYDAAALSRKVREA